MLSNKKNIDYAFRALKHRHRLDQHQICSVFATQFSPYSKKSNDPINKDDKKKEEKCSPPKINVVGFIKPTVHDPYRITIKDIEVKPIKMTSIKYARSVLYLSKRRKNPLAKSKSLPVINPYRNLLMMWLMQSLTFDFFGRKGSDGNRKGSDSSRNDSDIEKPRVEENYDKEQENKPSDERGGTNAGYYQTSSNYYFSNPYDVNYSNWATYNDKMNKNSQNQPQYYQNAGKQYDPYNYWNNYYQQFDQNNQYHGGYGNMMHGQQQTPQQAQQQQGQQQQAQQHQSQQQQQVQQQQMQQHQQQMQQKQQQIQQQMQQQMQKQMQQQQKMQQQMQQQQKLQQQKMQQHQQQMQQQPQQYQQTQSYQQTQQYQQPHQYQQAQHYQQAQQYKHAQQYHQTQQCQPPQTQVPQPQAQNQHYYTYPQYQFNQQQQGQGQGQGQTQNQNNQQPQSPHPNYTPPRVDNIYNHYGWYQNPYVNPFATNAFMTNRMVNMSRQNNNSNSNMTETHEAEIPNWMRHRYETDPNVNRNFWKYDETGLKRAESDSELSKKSDQDYQAEGDSQRRDASGDRQDEKHSDSSDYKSKWQQASDRSIDSSSKDSTTRQIDNIINLGPPESQTDGSAPTKTDGMTASQRLQEKVSTELFKTGRTTTSPQDSKSRH